MPAQRSRLAGACGFALAFLVSLSLCAPAPANLVYPLQQQRPPVARVNQTWTWTLLPGTFNASSGATLSLSSRSLPAWATFDAATATFAGLPALGDLGSTTVTVQANVSGIAQGTLDSFTLLVLDAPAAYVNVSLRAQLPSASSLGDGTVLTPSGALQIPPDWSFSLGFQQYTFQDASRSRIYYTAYQVGTTELPSWLKFDNQTVTFDGLAPFTRGEYSFVLFGSDQYGFGDVQQSLSIIVGYHSFELITSLPAINSSTGSTISYTVPISGLVVDNTTIASSNVSVAVALAGYPYLAFDAATRHLYGTLPSTLAPSNLSLPVTFTDSYNDTVSVGLPLVVQAALFSTATLPVLDVFPGKAFSANLTAYGTNPSATYTATVTPKEAQDWLKLDVEPLIVSGTAPEAIPAYGNATIVFTAHDPITGVQNNATLIVAVSRSTSTSGSLPSASGALHPTPHGLLKSQKLAIGLTLGLGFLLFIVLALCWRRFCRTERRLRRDGSEVLFEPAAVAPVKPSPAQSKGTTLIGTPVTPRDKTGEKTSPGRKSIIDSDAAQRDAAAAVAAAESSTPRRIGLMGLFRGGTPKKQVSTISLPLQSQNSLYGLGIGDDAPVRHNIVVVTDDAAGTYAPGDSGPDVRRVAEDSDFERSSSWESGGSSSLFYSDDSVQGQRRQRRGPPSAPRQRRDFLPLPIRTLPTSDTLDSNASAASAGAIRMVTSRSDGTSDASGSRSDSESNHSRRYDSSSYPDLAGSDGSIASVPAPRLIPFTSERLPSQSSNDRRRQSHRVDRDSAVMMDAEEDDDEPAWNRRSAAYAPPQQGSPTHSAVFFETPRASASAWRSPVMSEAADGVRLVGSPVSAAPSGSHYSHQPHRRNPSVSTYGEPTRTLLTVGHHFRFTPAMNPPPFVSITSSPGRGGPPRATYQAFLDTDDEEDCPLPPWLQFDQASLQVFGTPREEDVGVVSFYIVERKAMQMPGSPTRSGATPMMPQLQEQVVGRYVLDVAVADEEQGGVLQVISY
ncbi:hypothetical protein RQP46_000256 [Phenoliferia psychrophenolica]